MVVRLHWALVIRVILGISLLFVVLQTLLLMTNCRCTDASFDNNMETYQRRSQDGKILDIMNSYEEKIKTLKSELKSLQDEMLKCKKVDKFLISEELYHNKKSLTEKTFLNSFLPKSEFEVIPYKSFTAKHLFGDIGYLSKRPSASPIGQQASEMRDVLTTAIRALNHDVESIADRVNIDSFSEGIMRNDLMHGTVYDLYFLSKHAANVFKRIKLFRPFGNIEVIGKPETINSAKEWINLILPLSGRLDTFKSFMDRFIEICIRVDHRVFLSIVYFGHEGRDEIRQIMLNISQQESFENYKVIFSDEEFNRGKGIQQGVDSWEKGNVLMFFCDVDVYFTSEFLDRCRLHSSPRNRIYYPIVFSQYNPEIVFGGKAPPTLEVQIQYNLNYDSGFWRDFGFGMTCQFRDDFLNVGGFDLSIKGWGGEDVSLYKQHLRTSLTIIRSYDRGILHIYHQKNCIRTLSDQQFISCLQSKAVTEGSHKQLGMLAFGPSLISGNDPKWSQRLQSSLTQLSDKNTQEMKIN